MALSSLRSFVVKQFLFTALTFVVWTCAACLDSFDSVLAQESKTAEAKDDETDPDYVVPDGTPDQIMKFLDKLESRKTRFANRQESVDHAIKLLRANISAGDKILGQHTDAKVAANAAKLKLSAWMKLAANNIGDSPKVALAESAKLKQDERPEVAKMANMYWMPIRIFTLGTLTDSGRKELVDEVMASVAESQFGREPAGLANLLAETLAEKEFQDEAGNVFESLAKLAKNSDDSKIRAASSHFEGLARKTRLPGSFLTLEGKTLEDKEFDWAKYRGKVVLVDFWATWCGPCLEELPNVLKNYEKFHDKGFEVVGISLDHKKRTLERFLEKNEIPWVQLYDEEVQDGDGWSHPMAKRYGISAIPATILVDQEGKVISMTARGPELGALLTKLLNKPE